MRTRVSSPTLIEWGVIVFGFWQARDVLEAWQTSPKDKGGGYLFLLWLTPLLIHCYHDHWFSRHLSKYRFRSICFALLAILMGTLGKLNFFCYVGLAFALTNSFLESKLRGRYYWVISSCVWMPFFGYFMGGIQNEVLLSLKFILLTGGIAPLIHHYLIHDARIET